MFDRAESSETGVAVETWPAQPVYGAVAANEGGRSAIVDQGIVLYGERASWRSRIPTKIRSLEAQR
jgi:hypothetical protein